MTCNQCARLATEVRFRERDYALAQECVDSVTAPEDTVLFRKLKLRLDDARLGRDLSRLELENHQKDHGRAI
jgi:hypothetical protein